MNEGNREAHSKLAPGKQREIRAEASVDDKEVTSVTVCFLAYQSFTQERAHQDFHERPANSALVR